MLLQPYIHSLDHIHLSVTEVRGVGGCVGRLGGGGGASVDVGQQGPGAGQGHVDNQPGLQQHLQHHHSNAARTEMHSHEL